MNGYDKRITCASCGGNSFETILDLGIVPLAGYFPTKEQLKNDLIEEYQTNTFSEEEEINEIENNSDESETKANELEDNQIEQNNEDLSKSSENLHIESAQDNLEDSSDDEKTQDL